MDDANVHDHQFVVTIRCTDDTWDRVFPGIRSQAEDDPGMTSTEYAQEAIEHALFGLRGWAGRALGENALIDVCPTRDGER